ncbi:MAG: TAXI family TRAP transporter solute-binding subunit [Alphaproteobacteria bacterium]|nr:TAXI family TRAP transporter solute-binding subunit [Alphaproteobacteria bacterium]
MKTLVAALSLTAVLAAPAAAQQVYTIASNPQGTQFYTLATGIAKLVDEKLKVQVRVQPMAGSSTYLPLLNRGELDFGLTNVDDARTSYFGTGNYEGRPNSNLRLISTLFPLYVSLMVPADSPVRKIEDIKGMRLPSGFGSQTIGRLNNLGVLASVGLTPDDVKPVPVVNLFAGAEALAQGRVDGAVVNPGTAQVQKAHADLAARGGIRFVSIGTTPEGIKRMQEVMVSRPALVQPAAHRPGVVAPTWFLTFDAFLVTNDRASDQMAYDIAKAMHQGKDALVASAPFMSEFEPNRMAVKMDMPFHPGAVRYFTEIGQWPPKD